jgi:hypothetical protein|tara:strand:- start:1391 stop:2149 length:759 start_codon:yes stop_codon:yes gene_type:complete
MKHTAKWIPLPTQPISEGEAATTNRLRTYSIKIKLDAPHPSPITATTRIIDGEFVWERLVTCKGRAEAVSIAGNWFQDLRRKGGVGKVLVGMGAHQRVTVDDVGNECLYGSNFKPYISNNRLLDKETIERVIEQSKGNLKINDTPVVKGKVHPSLIWATDKKVNSLPIKIGFSTYAEPDTGGMKEALAKAAKRSSARKRRNEPSWFEDARSLEPKLLIRRMKDKGLLESKETYSDSIIRRLKKSGKSKQELE